MNKNNELHTLKYYRNFIMNYVLAGFGFCNPFKGAPKRCDKNIQVDVKREHLLHKRHKRFSKITELHSNTTVTESRSNKPQIVVKSAKVSSISTYETENVSVPPKVFIRDDNFLILKPDELFAKHDDGSLISDYPKTSLCVLLDSESQFDNQAPTNPQLRCKRRLMGDTNCDCSHCKALFVIQDSLKHPGAYGFASSRNLTPVISSKKITDKTSLNNAKANNSTLLRIENTLQQLLQRVGYLEQLHKNKHKKSKRKHVCDNGTQYSKHVITKESSVESDAHNNKTNDSENNNKSDTEKDMRRLRKCVPQQKPLQSQPNRKHSSKRLLQVKKSSTRRNKINKKIRRKTSSKISLTIKDVEELHNKKNCSL